jgi:transposase
MKQAVVAGERLKLGRFVLATNDTDLSADKLLEYYKGQGAVERGFRFLKDRDFRVSEVFLKKPERIEALAMVMVLSLFVYSYAEWKLREQMAKSGETVLSQLRKPTGRPTLKWVFFKYDNVTAIKLEDECRCHVEVANMNDELWKILRLLGPACEKYYL